jgi:hypothetical protein
MAVPRTTKTRRPWIVVAAVVGLAGVAVALLVLLSSDGNSKSDTATGATTTTEPSDTGSSSTETPATTEPPATTAAPTTTPPADAAATPEEVVRAHYGTIYIGDCASAPAPEDLTPGSRCSISVPLGDDQVAVFVGPPSSEFIEALLVGRDDSSPWALVDTYAFPPLGEQDPAQPEWVSTALAIKDGRTPS